MRQTLKAIDLFAGIGGIRLAFEKAGFDIVYSNDNDKYACQTYNHNFGEIDCSDIKLVNAKKLPKYDVLLAGFPCQSFSQLGKGLGFSDPRGNLFFEIEKILYATKPEAFLLENVRHLKTHDNGRTFQTIMKVLEGRLGYNVHTAILNGKNFGLPQNRERIYIVGFRSPTNFTFPVGSKEAVRVKNILEKKVPAKFYLSAKYLKGLENHKKRHSKNGHGFGYEIINPNGIANTLVAGNMGRERNLIKDNPNIKYDHNEMSKRNNKGVRKLTVREYARLQGFPDTFSFPVSDNQAYKQIGNSVCVPVVFEIAKKIKAALLKRPSSIVVTNYPIRERVFAPFAR